MAGGDRQQSTKRVPEEMMVVDGNGNDDGNSNCDGNGNRDSMDNDANADAIYC